MDLKKYNVKIKEKPHGGKEDRNLWGRSMVEVKLMLNMKEIS